MTGKARAELQDGAICILERPSGERPAVVRYHLDDPETAARHALLEAGHVVGQCGPTPQRAVWIAEAGVVGEHTFNSLSRRAGSDDQIAA